MEAMSPATRKRLGYESGAALMAEGPQVLHEHIATKLGKALGLAMPQMDVRFSNLSVTADVVVVDEDSKYELPTIPNTLMKTFISPKKRIVRKEILKDVSGPTWLRQVGPVEDAECSVPMTKNITVEGNISFNNVQREQIIKTLPQFVAYVNQRDKHYPVLTVKETLEYAHKFCGAELSEHAKKMLSQGTPEENEEALRAANAMFAHYPDVIIQQLGLQNCQNTIVGDAMTRGVSGGERKRVTTGEMEFSTKYVTLMDEISTGLDSAATYDIINTQRSVAHKLRKTVVIALLQPSPEVFALFDDVMMSKVEEYFESLGFKCPPQRDIADYLLDLGTQVQYQYQVEHPTKQPRRASEFADTFKESRIYMESMYALEAPYDPELLHSVEQNMKPMPMFSQSFVDSTLTLLKRQLTITYRNKPFIFGRVLMIAVSVVLGVVFSSVMFLSMGQSSQIPTYMAEREVFYKQRGANFFRTASYVLATSASQIPLAFVETIIFGSLVYWLCGFESEFQLFIIFEFVLLVMNLAMGMWFFFLSSVGPNENVVTPLGIVSVS
ncbi:hypothetical protein PHYSODRAFT_252888 [Phytophthora sojae]|uniref:ABC transporter domain-containing protein n=1 Tax=Phytophthora sojae (strain P6497) TaxID=1094619 RepID=G4ZQ44_PHYSP|nr:hypothetical protein PHYSODRAFT_252888 [Phytophthora sojae]EGZ14433.1 hypothetical protein PHYSODRAFT_252888 [Phytophthora sojae]|eukprot:XP_009528182.1 hypothetical protein PHYSODRAFT_252888 [Phytophthora sojae]